MNEQLSQSSPVLEDSERMNKAIKYLNDLADRIEDSKRANATLYLISTAIAHAEGTLLDYSSALSLLYESVEGQISDMTALISEINGFLKV